MTKYNIAGQEVVTVYIVYGQWYKTREEAEAAHDKMTLAGYTSEQIQECEIEKGSTPKYALRG